MTLLKKQLSFLIALFVGLVGMVEAAQRPARHYRVIKDLHTSELVLDVAKILFTQLAMLCHEQEKSELSEQQDALVIQDSPVVANKMPNGLYLVANALGIGRNAVALYCAMKPDLLAKNKGNIFALSSSTMTLAIDSYFHIKNIIESRPYLYLSNNDRMAVGLVQILQLYADYLSKFGLPGVWQTPEFQTSMHNVQVAAEALEKLVLSGSYASEEDVKLVIVAFGGIAGANLGSAAYYGLRASQTGTTTQIIPNTHLENFCSGPVCRHGFVPHRPQVVRLGACKHDLCIDCSLALTNQGKPREENSIKNIACPCCSRVSVVDSARLRDIIEADIAPEDGEERPLDFEDFLRNLGLRPGAVLPDDGEWEADWEDPEIPTHVYDDEGRVGAIARGVAPSRIIPVFAAGATPAQRRQWYEDNLGAGKADDDFMCAICNEDNDGLAGRQMARLDCGHIYCLDCCAQDVIGRRQDEANYECATCRGHCNLHAAHADRRV